jgi:hypothetical protein
MNFVKRCAQSELGYPLFGFPCALRRTYKASLIILGFKQRLFLGLLH